MIWNFLKSHITPAAIIGGIIIQIIIYLLQKTALFGYKATLKYSKKSGVKNAAKIITHYEKEYRRVEKLRNRDFETLLELTDRIYHNMIIMFGLIGIFLIVETFDPTIEVGPYLFIVYVAFLTAISKQFFSCLVNLIYNQGLIAKSRNFEKYKLKMERKISFWQSMKEHHQE